MRLTLLVTTAALALLAAGCGTKDAGADGGATAATGSAKPAPPPNAAKGCEVKLTGKHAPFMSKDGLEYTMTNATTKAIRFCQITIYAYDKAGKQIGRDGMSENHELKPGESYTSTSGLTIEDAAHKSLAKAPGVSFEVAVGHIIFVDDSEWQDESAAPFERPKGGKK